MQQIQNNKMFHQEFRKSLRQGLNQNGDFEKTARTIGSSVQRAERQLVEAMKDPENLVAVKQAELRYNKVMQAFEMFSRVMQNRFQVMMQGIRALSIR